MLPSSELDQFFDAVETQPVDQSNSLFNTPTTIRTRSIASSLNNRENPYSPFREPTVSRTPTPLKSPTPPSPLPMSLVGNYQHAVRNQRR